MAIQNRNITIGTSQGDRLKKLRIAKKLTQVELSEMIGVKQNTISAYEKDERGTCRFPVKSLIALAQCLDVSIDWLITGKEKSIFADGKLIPLCDNYAPIIEWNEVSRWKSIRKNQMSLARCEKVPVQGFGGTNCFALKIERKHENAIFLEGEIVIINPDWQPTHGCYVLGAMIYNEVVSDEVRLWKITNDIDISKLSKRMVVYGVAIGKVTNLL